MPWIDALGKAHVHSGGEKADYPRIEAHLRRYTARNTFDYFIHKDLGGFLRRELDFYIKNEVMHLDDVESESAARVEQYLSKIKIVRRIAGKIIDFLAQLEDFQKKLWLKKKLVVESSYCVTIDRVPEELYSEVASNDAQRKAWVRLYGVDKLEGHSIPLSVDFLKKNRGLSVDTSLFSEMFTQRVVSSIGDIDASLTGVMIHSDNFQALRFAQSRFSETFKAIYIDPPYNTAREPLKNSLVLP